MSSTRSSRSTKVSALTDTTALLTTNKRATRKVDSALSFSDVASKDIAQLERDLKKERRLAQAKAEEERRFAAEADAKVARQHLAAAIKAKREKKEAFIAWFMPAIKVAAAAQVKALAKAERDRRDAEARAERDAKVQASAKARNEQRAAEQKAADERRVAKAKAEEMLNATRSASRRNARESVRVATDRARDKMHGRVAEAKVVNRPRLEVAFALPVGTDAKTEAASRARLSAIPEPFAEEEEEVAVAPAVGLVVGEDELDHFDWTLLNTAPSHGLVYTQHSLGFTPLPNHDVHSPHNSMDLPMGSPPPPQPSQDALPPAEPSMRQFYEDQLPAREPLADETLAGPPPPAVDARKGMPPKPPVILPPPSMVVGRVAFGDQPLPRVDKALPTLYQVDSNGNKVFSKPTGALPPPPSGDVPMRQAPPAVVSSTTAPPMLQPVTTLPPTEAMEVDGSDEAVSDDEAEVEEKQSVDDDDEECEKVRQMFHKLTRRYGGHRLDLSRDNFAVIRQFLLDCKPASVAANRLKVELLDTLRVRVLDKDGNVIVTANGAMDCKTKKDAILEELQPLLDELRHLASRKAELAERMRAIDAEFGILQVITEGEEMSMDQLLNGASREAYEYLLSVEGHSSTFAFRCKEFATLGLEHLPIRELEDRIASLRFRGVCLNVIFSPRHFSSEVVHGRNTVPTKSFEIDATLEQAKAKGPAAADKAILAFGKGKNNNKAEAETAAAKAEAKAAKAEAAAAKAEVARAAKAAKVKSKREREPASEATDGAPELKKQKVASRLKPAELIAAAEAAMAELAKDDRDVALDSQRVEALKAGRDLLARSIGGKRASIKRQQQVEHDKAVEIAQQLEADRRERQAEFDQTDPANAIQHGTAHAALILASAKAASAKSKADTQLDLLMQAEAEVNQREALKRTFDEALEVHKAAVPRARVRNGKRAADDMPAGNGQPPQKRQADETSVLATKVAEMEAEREADKAKVAALEAMVKAMMESMAKNNGQ